MDEKALVVAESQGPPEIACGCYCSYNEIIPPGTLSLLGWAMPDFSNPDPYGRPDCDTPCKNQVVSNCSVPLSSLIQFPGSPSTCPFPIILSDFFVGPCGTQTNNTVYELQCDNNGYSLVNKTIIVYPSLENLCLSVTLTPFGNPQQHTGFPTTTDNIPFSLIESTSTNPNNNRVGAWSYSTKQSNYYLNSMDLLCGSITLTTNYDYLGLSNIGSVLNFYVQC